MTGFAKELQQPNTTEPEEVSLVEETDHDIINRSKREPEAFGILYKRYHGEIFGYALRRTGNIDQAEDLTAETFSRALANISRYEDTGPFPAWLTTIAQRLQIDQYRHSRIIHFEQLEDTAAGQVPDRTAYSPEAVLLKNERDQILHSQVASLPKRQQLVLNLAHVQDMSYTEIAKVLKLTPQAVKSLVFRAHDNLRRLQETDGTNHDHPRKRKSSHL